MILKLYMNKKIKCYYISPHFDDALASCTYFIIKNKNKYNHCLINIFSNDNKKQLTKRHWEQLKNNQEIFDKNLYNIRKIENKNACNFLKINYINLSYIDAVYRIDNNSQNFLYKNKESLFNKINLIDYEIIFKIYNELKLIFNNNKNNILFFNSENDPHIDHKILNIIGKIFLKEGYNVLFYENPFYFKKKNKKYKIILQPTKEQFFIKKQTLFYYKTQIKNNKELQKINYYQEFFY